MASDKVVQVTDDSFESEVNQSSIPVLVDFWASWCAPCKAISPIVDQLADEFDGQVKICKLNVDENPATPGQFGVRGIPTLIVFKDGKVFDQVVGATTTRVSVAELPGTVGASTKKSMGPRWR